LGLRDQANGGSLLAKTVSDFLSATQKLSMSVSQ
jgi:hypothetical protein